MEIRDSEYKTRWDERIGVFGTVLEFEVGDYLVMGFFLFVAYPRFQVFNSMS